MRSRVLSFLAGKSSWTGNTPISTELDPLGNCGDDLEIIRIIRQVSTTRFERATRRAPSPRLDPLRVPTFMDRTQRCGGDTEGEPRCRYRPPDLRPPTTPLRPPKVTGVDRAPEPRHARQKSLIVARGNASCLDGTPTYVTWRMSRTSCALRSVTSSTPTRNSSPAGKPTYATDTPRTPLSPRSTPRSTLSGDGPSALRQASVPPPTWVAALLCVAASVAEATPAGVKPH